MAEIMDPTLCEEVSPTRLWTSISWTIQYVLARPLLFGLLLLLLVVLVQRRFGWGRSHNTSKGAIILSITIATLYLAIASPLVSNLGNRLLAIPISPDDGKSADAIVVLGRGPEQNEPRAKVAAELWKEKRAPLIFLSGRRDALVMADLLRAQSVVESAIAGDPCSLTTEQNAVFTAEALMPERIGKIILVTDLAHMWRSRLTFESFGFEVITHVTPLKENTSAIERSFLVIREGLGLISYAVMGRYADRNIEFRSSFHMRK